MISKRVYKDMRVSSKGFHYVNRESDVSRTISAFKNRLIRTVKESVYGNRGEPYLIAGHEFRFPVGARPVRLSYIQSDDRLACEEALAIASIVETLSEGDTAVDVGAHVGVYSALMSWRCGVSGSVISFEPDPVSIQEFSRLFDLNTDLKRPRLEGVACSDKVGVETFFSSEGDSRSSFRHGDLKSAMPIQVDTVTLDSYIEMNGLAPRFVKIDVEGAEIHVLRGAKNLLAGPSKILCELHPFAWERFGVSFAEFVDLLKASGRRIRYLGAREVCFEKPFYGLAMLER